MKLPHYLQTIVSIVLLLLLAGSAFAQQKSSIAIQPTVYQQKLQSSALLFMENRGQVADDKGNPQPDILFTANSGGAKIYLTATGIHYQFSKMEYPKGYNPFSKEPVKDLKQEETLRQQVRISTHRFTVALQGANPHSVVSKQAQSRYYENYYLPQCPNGITGVQGYEKIVFKDVYPNIDWVVYGKGGFMKYDFLVHPGGNPANIKLKIKDAGKVSITSQGELLMQTTLGEVKEKAPVSYSDGHAIPSRFKQNSNGTIGFDVQKQLDKELRIDPSIVWSTYYGGSETERGMAVKVKGSTIYLAGFTNSTSGIASSGYQNNYGGGSYDSYLASFDTSGNRLWATYVGGSDLDEGLFCTVDGNDNIYFGGFTSSTSAIAINGFQNNYGGGLRDAFLVKLNSNGIRLWGTYFGGESFDIGRCCEVDNNGNVYVAGTTTSVSGIGFGGFQNNHGNSGYDFDCFLVKFSDSGNRLWSTYYGGQRDDDAYGCTVDVNNNNVFITGTTQSSSSIASNGYQNVQGDGGIYADGFLVKFSSGGNRLWGTYFGGNGGDFAYGCTTDFTGNIYIVGSTNSSTGIAFNGMQGVLSGNIDAFIAKFNTTGNLLWSTYFGATGGEFCTNCCTDANNNLIIAGYCTSTTSFAYNGFQNTINGSWDGYIARFDPSGNRIWCSYYGGNSSTNDDINSCATDNAGNIYIAGFTTSTSGLAVNGFQNTYGGGTYDAFLAKIGDLTCIASTQPVVNATADTICSGSSTTLTIASGSLNSAIVWQWRKDSCTGPTVGSGTSITVSPTLTSTYFVRGEGGCTTSGNCTSKRIVVNPATTATVILTANPAGPIIAGTTVIFTATPTNGGTAPIYTFKVNGIPAQTGSGNVYTSSALQNGDVVSVTLTSNTPCISNPTVISNLITMVVAAPCIAPTTPTIATNYDTVCTGATPTLTVVSGNLNNATHWQWYTGSCGGTPIGNTSSITVTPAATTTYYLRGEGGCITPGNCVSKTINVKPAPVATFATVPAALCAGDTLTVTFTGSAPPNATYNWNWGGGRVISGAGFGPYQVVYTAPGSIGLTVGNGTCNVAAIAQAINPVPVPEVALNISDSVGCAPQRIIFSAASINDNNWTWALGDGTTLSNVNTPVEHTYAAGVYMPSLTVYRGNCSNKAFKTIRIYQRPNAAFSVQPGPNTPLPLSQANFVFNNASQNASRYLWRFGDSESSTLANPVHRYVSPGTYTVSLYAYSTGNCADTFELKPFIIKADTVAAFTIPTAFSPNGDGINDTWMITVLQQYSNCRVSIYNRWGQAVFASTGYTKAWDGKYAGKPLPVDIYCYVITLENKSYTGSIMLLR